MKKILILLIFSTGIFVNAQNIPLPQNLPQGHPRLLTTPENKPVLQKQVEDETWAKEVMEGILNRIDPYVEKTLAEPDCCSHA